MYHCYELCIIVSFRYFVPVLAFIAFSMNVVMREREREVSIYHFYVCQSLCLYKYGVLDFASIETYLT